MQSRDKTLMHGCDYAGQDPTGWIVTEKFDGCRAYWDGARLWSRGGCTINAPAWFTRGLPAMALDCELWAGYGTLGVARLACQRGRFTPDCRLIIFDCPQAAGGWCERIKTAPRTRHAAAVSSAICRGRDDLRVKLAAVRAKGGEGLVIRHPAAPYTPGRVRTVLKVKPGFLP